MIKTLYVCDRCGAETENPKEHTELGDKLLCDECLDAYQDRKVLERQAVDEVWKGFWPAAGEQVEKPKSRRG